MNYGKFFRLNKHLSRIEDGFAIYDYIDLPAYFTPSKDNLMSPKYPISVMIMGDSVVFKLHYSAYKIEEMSKREAQDESIKGYSNYPQYIYNIEVPSLISENKVKGGDTTKIVHMEEIILELPFTDTVGRSLSDTIRDIYDTQFPLVQRDNGKDSDLSSKEKSSGGRYLEKLIRTRYLEEKVDEVRDVNSHFYESLRKISDGTASYSTLWLMGLVKGDKNDVRYRRTDKKGNVIGFLRKLLLDFMFDLKHSDVFQNSVHYQKMYSGLMSDFYFSALMHKCEYYYYRRITSQAIGDVEDSYKTRKKIIESENLTETERKEKTIIIEKEKEKRIKAIAILYANELVKAEDLWVKDIMTPQAEKDYEHQYPSKDPIRRYFREFIEYYNFEQWPSWFAEPEEEMRRVCFTMKDETGERHICNADTLTKYLGFSRDNDDNTINKILDIRDDDREQISRWFLKHYAFSDVLHLHLFKHANLFFILFFALPILISWFSRSKLVNVYLWTLLSIILFITIAILSCCIHKYNDCKSCILYKGCRSGVKSLKNIITESAIFKTRWKTIKGKVRNTLIFMVFVFAFVYLGLWEVTNNLIKTAISQNNIYFTSILVGLFVIFISYLAFQRSFVSILHLFLPRLVASIALAWITLSMGFDLYVSYFDSKPSIPYIAVICVVVFLFVVYSINLVIPHSLPLRKLLRSLELMIISYFISLSVGFLIINFLGPKYLERGGYINDYYTQHVTENEDGTLEWTQYRKQDSKLAGDTLKDSNRIDTTKVILEKVCSIDKAINDTTSHVRLVKDLEKVKIKRKDDFVAAKIDFWGMDIFILRDFLNMFAFIAMFTGIFIQLIIFGDNKQMTEL